MIYNLQIAARDGESNDSDQDDGSKDDLRLQLQRIMRCDITLDAKDGRVIYKEIKFDKSRLKNMNELTIRDVDDFQLPESSQQTFQTEYDTMITTAAEGLNPNNEVGFRRQFHVK